LLAEIRLLDTAEREELRKAATTIATVEKQALQAINDHAG
jgi:hypothetical protein